jgi:hypothetical protein
MRYLQREIVVLSLAVIVAVDVGGLVAQNTEPKSFSEYALSNNLKPDEVYTVELLIDRVRSHFDDNRGIEEWGDVTALDVSKLPFAVRLRHWTVGCAKYLERDLR